MTQSKKLYVLDTNVLLYDPLILDTFRHGQIGIPIVVLEELDNLKSESTERGRNARQFSRQLDSLRLTGSLCDGVKIPSGQTLKIIFLPNVSFSPDVPNTNDNRIILGCKSMQDSGVDIVFVSKDINARIKADVLGLKTEDYINEKLGQYDLYKGWTEVDVPAKDLLADKPKILDDILEEKKILINEFVLLSSGNNHYNYRLFRYLGNQRFKSVEEPNLRWPIGAKNPQQLMTMDLLFDPQIQCVSLIGQAGTGKTFLTLLAGLQQVIADDIYKKMLITRPIVPLGADIGFLPGDLNEKLHTWMQPVYDNMSIILDVKEHQKHLQSVKKESHGDRFNRRERREREGRTRHNYNSRGHSEYTTGIKSLDDMIASGKISLEAITYMRGRSIPYQFVFIDEVQNLTPHEVKTLISRIGEGSKIILGGDPYQIDSPYLDVNSNGLVVASNRFKGQSIFGSVFLETTERSELSRLASELL